MADFGECGVVQEFNCNGDVIIAGSPRNELACDYVMFLSADGNFLMEW